MDKQQRYPVYDYLKFIWQKKYFLIGFTILCMIIAAVYNFGKTTSYTSTALVFTGNANNDELSKPTFITYNYKDLISTKIVDSFQVKIEEPMAISLTLSGSDKELVESEVTKAAKKYADDLKKNFDIQIGARKAYADALKDRIDALKKSQSFYNDDDKLLTSTELLEQYHMNEIKLSLPEEPNFKGVSTTAASNHLLRNSLLGGALGFQLMLVLLVFWKYIINARRYTEQ
jgi:hypothetical protein